MRKSIISTIFFFISLQFAHAQFSLLKGDNVLELSGILTTTFNYRFYNANQTDYKKNSFGLDYAVFRLDGIYKKDLHYELQFNLAKLSTTTSSTTEDPGSLMDAYFEYSGLSKYVNIKFGFTKLPFGRSSLIPTAESVFLQRPEVSRGDVFSRRDIGIALNKEFWKQRINIIAGIYSGVGEAILNGGDNDPNGKFEYIGRAEFSYPIKFRYREIDEIHVPKPVFGLGGGIRYSEKTIATGPDYSIRTIDGKKTSYSGDVNVKFKGISFLGEVYRFHMAPNNTGQLLGYPTTYFESAGYTAELNYFFKKHNSVLAFRYDEYNPSDLIKDDNERNISVGYNYLFSGMNSVFKVHYFYRLKRDDTKEKWANDQIRIAYQLQF